MRDSKRSCFVDGRKDLSTKKAKKKDGKLDRS